MHARARITPEWSLALVARLVLVAAITPQAPPLFPLPLVLPRSRLPPSKGAQPMVVGAFDCDCRPEHYHDGATIHGEVPRVPGRRRHLPHQACPPKATYRSCRHKRTGLTPTRGP